jgi:hypothetical protein
MKTDYYIDYISKEEAETILKKHHYLSVKKISKDFKSGVNFGLFYGGIPINDGMYFGGELVGVCIFTGFPVPELSVSMFGLERDDQDGLYELSRLCLIPSHQEREHNITSWFTSRCLKAMKVSHNSRAVLSYSDTGHHKGVIYRACNFKYYGKTKQKSDFFIKEKDGIFTKMSRGETKGIDGEWRKRSLKDRFVIIWDKKLKMKWMEIKRK